jgi:hypothetical protein
MCAVAGLEVPDLEKPVLAGMLERHLAAFEAVVGALDLSDVASADTFEAGWDE